MVPKFHHVIKPSAILPLRYHTTMPSHHHTTTPPPHHAHHHTTMPSHHHASWKRLVCVLLVPGTSANADMDADVGLTETSGTELRALRKEVPGGGAGGEVLVDMEDVTSRHDDVDAVVGLTETSSTDLRALRKEVPGGSAGGEVAERRIVLYVGGDNTDGAEAGASLSVADSDDAAASYMLNISDTTEGTMKRPPRWRPTAAQKKVLEDTFALFPIPSTQQRNFLAADLGLTPRQVYNHYGEVANMRWHAMAVWWQREAVGWLTMAYLPLWQVLVWFQNQRRRRKEVPTLRMHAQHADIHKVRDVYSSYSCLAVARSTSLMFKVTVLRWTSPPRVSQVLTTLILRLRPEIATATHDCNPRLRPATAKNRDRDPHPPTAIVPCDRKSRPRRPNRDATRPRSATDRKSVV